MMKQKISVLGSTGSIGLQSLEVIDRLGLSVSALSARRSTIVLEHQVRKYRPEILSLFTEEAARDMKVRLGDTDTRIVSGPEGLVEAASVESAGTVITAVVGTVGLEPTLAAIRGGKRIALANKETLVCAGEIVMKEAREHGAEIVPVDSEHSAIFQCMDANRRDREVKNIILTSSGGPFRGKSLDELLFVTREMALKHPNWKMGLKITIDSATMMNKGLEFIEAMHLFGMPPDRIRVLVHPESIVHSMVEYTDNSVIAQMSLPDMRLPIQYALTYPERMESLAGTLDLAKIGSLTFENPDYEAFPWLALAMETARTGGTSCAVLNAANEVAVQLFLENEIPFFGIYELVYAALEAVGNKDNPTLEDILAADAEARKYVSEIA